jgi:hypothetical protein
MKRDRTILAFLNPAVLAIEKIAWYYVQALYSPIPLQKLERRDAYRTWRGLGLKECGGGNNGRE